MWQEILAIDTKLSQNMESQDLRPLYLKRRLQLLQRQQNLCIGKSYYENYDAVIPSFWIVI